MDTYSRLTGVILSKQKQMTAADMYNSVWRPNTKDVTLFESMADRWVNVIALLVLIAAAFGIAYLAFMRADVT
jgi:ABC-type transport system involved in multi-copper enzyme maturation permease subunit